MKKNQFFATLSTLVLSTFFFVACDSKPEATVQTVKPQENVIVQKQEAKKEVFRAKKQAPVKISTSLDENGTGKVNVQFLRAAQDVNVSINGVDGLSISNQTFASKSEYEQGENLELSINFVAPEGQSYVNVLVSGNFGGGNMGKIEAFPFGTLSKEQKLARQKPLAEDKEGRKIIILPMEEN